MNLHQLQIWCLDPTHLTEVDRPCEFDTNDETDLSRGFDVSRARLNRTRARRFMSTGYRWSPKSNTVTIVSSDLDMAHHGSPRTFAAAWGIINLRNSGIFL